MRALIIAEDGFEDSELLYPLYRLREEGLDVDVASSRRGTLAGKVGYRVEATRAYGDCRAEAYACLVLPGGRSPERARQHPEVLELTRAFVDAGKPVAAICHGPQILLSAGLVAGRTVTCYAGIRDDLIAAGATWVDAPCAVDGPLVTARTPADLPPFMAALIRQLPPRSG